VTAELRRAGPLSQVGLRVPPGGDAAARVEGLLGVALPLAPNTVAEGVLWLGPDEWLIVGRPEGEPRLREALVGEGAAVELSCNRVALELSGPQAPEVLASCCSLDLHGAVFTTGCCAQTLVAGAPVIIERVDERPGFRLLVRPSLVAYVESWLADGIVGLAAAGDG
jgi:sarcosine oxidase subunit gamma